MAIKPIPHHSVSIVGPDNGIAAVWYQWLQSLLKPGPIAPITVGASPFTYTASERGLLIVTGGTVTALAFTRGGTTIDVTGQQTTALAAGDSLAITYAVLPVIQFVPI